MTDKKRKFVREYLKDMNCTQAAIRAGYSARTAKQQGSRLLTCVDVREAVQTVQREEQAKACRTREEWLAGLNRFCDHHNPTIALKAHEQLGKALGFNEPDRQEIKHSLHVLTDEALEAIIAGVK